jgi:hypothetical protein
MPDHVLGNSCLGNVDSEFEQFALNSRRSPEAIISAHGADELTNISGNPGPSRPAMQASPEHNNRKQARCQAITVSGLTMMRAFFQPGQSRSSRIQNMRSRIPKRGRGVFLLSTPSCWRRAMISRLRLWRERKEAMKHVRKPAKNGIMGRDLYHKVDSSAALIAWISSLMRFWRHTGLQYPGTRSMQQKQQ